MALPIVCSARYLDDGQGVLAFLYPPGESRGPDVVIGKWMARTCVLSAAEVEALRELYPAATAQAWAARTGFDVDDRRTRFGP